jgi:type IV pilus assembly protein PilA
MIVVAIVAILAAIAIPNFLRFQMKSKTAEATSNIGAIRTGEVSYYAENDTYILAADCPAAGGNDDVADPWPVPPIAVPGFDEIGFAPDGRVRFRYSVQAGVGADIADNFAVVAIGDLDEDGATSGYFVDTAHVDAGGILTYPRIIKETVATAVYSAGDDF